MKFKLLTGLGMLFLSLNTFAQKQNGGNENWTLLKTEGNVSVYYEQGTCGNAEVVFIRFVNNSSTTADINWSLWDGSKAKSISVNADETITGSCENRPRTFMLTERIPSGKTIKDLHIQIQVTAKP